MGRRAFLLLLAGAIAAFAAAALAPWDRLRREWIARKLVAAYPMLRFDPVGVARFVEVYEEKLHVIRRNPLKLLLEPLPENVVRTFLPSTDYFLNDEDDSRPLQFVAVYDPYASPCYNPFLERDADA